MKLNTVLTMTLATAILSSLPFIADADSFSLTNANLIVSWETKEGRPVLNTMQDKRTGHTLDLRGELFSLVLTNGRIIPASEFKLVRAPHQEVLAAAPGASRFAERLPG